MSIFSFRPSSKHTMKSGVMERRIGTAGSGTFGSTPEESPFSALCTVLMRLETSSVELGVLPTWDDTIIVVHSRRSLELGDSAISKVSL